MINLASRCHDLCRLNLSDVDLITEKGIEAIANECTNLEDICLSKCDLIDDKALEHIAKNAKNMRLLGLAMCPKITPTGTTNLIASLPSLQCIELSNTEGFEKVTVDWRPLIERLLPELKNDNVDEWKARVQSLLEAKGAISQVSDRLRILPTSAASFWALGSKAVRESNTMIVADAHGELWTNEISYDLERSVAVLEAVFRSEEHNAECIFGFSFNKRDWESKQSDALTLSISGKGGNQP